MQEHPISVPALPDPFDVARADRAAEVTWWRRATDDGVDTAFGRRLRRETGETDWARRAVAS
jgi:hypothetical protein